MSDISENLEDTNNNSKKSYEWKSEHEDILKIWADKAICFKTMHDRAYKKYWCLNAWFNIPIIILSTLTGTGNFAQPSFHSSYATMLVLLIGGANILSAILGTVAQYINVAGTLEGHRYAAISWDKYSRSIQVELHRVRKDRQEPYGYIKRCQEEFDRLIEISPDFSSDIIHWFNKLINTGEFIENNQACGVCFYEWFCLPCGLRGCKKAKCNRCCKDDDKEIRKEDFRVAWSQIDLPEVCGRIQPTKVIRDDNYSYNQNKYRVDNFTDEIDV